jgi:hypothetical protein
VELVAVLAVQFHQIVLQVQSHSGEKHRASTINTAITTLMYHVLSCTNTQGTESQRNTIKGSGVSVLIILIFKTHYAFP